MLVADVALQAKVIIIASDTCDKLPLWQDLDTAVAGASWLLVIHNRLLFLGEGAWNLLFLRLIGLGFGLGFSLGLGLWCNALGCAVNNNAVLNEALDHPVAVSRAVDAIGDTRGAKIIVASVAYTAVVVLIFHGLIAVVAVHNPRRTHVRRLGAEGETRVAASSCDVAKEVWIPC